MDTKKSYMTRLLPRLSIGLTGKCNLRCSMCNRPKEAADSTDLPDVIVDRILSISDTVRIGEVYFCGWGEPFLSERLFECISFFRSKGIPTIVQTNGSLLERYAERIAEEGPDYIDISLHGGNRESYEAIMVGGDRQAVFRGIDKIRGLKNRGRSGFGPVFRRFVFCASREGFSSLPDIVDLAGRYGVPAVFVQFLQEPYPRRQGLELSDIQDSGRYEKHYALALQNARTVGVLLQLDGLFFHYDSVLDETTSCAKETVRLCTSPWTVVEILHTGEFRVCGYPEQHNLIPLPEDFTLADIWNHAEVCAVRKGLLSGKMHAWCQRCGERPNGSLHDLRKKIQRTEFPFTPLGRIKKRISALVREGRW